MRIGSLTSRADVRAGFKQQQASATTQLTAAIQRAYAVPGDTCVTTLSTHSMLPFNTLNAALQGLTRLADALCTCNTIHSVKGKTCPYIPGNLGLPTNKQTWLVHPTMFNKRQTTSDWPVWSGRTSQHSWYIHNILPMWDSQHNTQNNHSCNAC